MDEIKQPTDLAQRTVQGPMMTNGPALMPGRMADMQPLQPIGKEQCQAWNEALNKYKAGKAKLEKRIKEQEKWWRLRNEFVIDDITDNGDEDWGFRTKTSWLFNVVMSKHADYHEAYPRLNFLPQAADDKDLANKLGKIVPVVLRQNRFAKTYSENGWQKLKGGTGVYKIFWEQAKHNGLGDISIVRRSLLNVFWQPGILDIQQSKYFFDVEMVDRETLIDEYPELKEEGLKGMEHLEQLDTEENLDYSEMVEVVDVYYKRRGKLHYAKFVGNHVLYATENDNELIRSEHDPITGNVSAVHTRASDGLYDHGMYPYVFDVLFPMEGVPTGLGYIDVGANAQTRIDITTHSMLENTQFAATPRYFSRGDGGVNEREFLNTKKKIVHVQNSLDEMNMKPIEAPNLSATHMSVMQNTIQELRETTGNTEAGNGIASSGVTAASAFAALQEASGKTSRDSTATTYECMIDLGYMVVELIRQFYDQPRNFRILGENGQEEFVSFDNSEMQPQWQGMIGGMDMGYRKPEFDIDIVPEKQTSYSRVSQNELALQFFGNGFFNPQLSDQAMACLDMMDFDGREDVMRKVQMNGLLQDELLRWQQLSMELAMRFAPDMVPGLSQQITGEGNAPVPIGTAEKPDLDATDNNKDTRVENARERANTASQPGGSTK